MRRKYAKRPEPGAPRRKLNAQPDKEPALLRMTPVAPQQRSAKIRELVDRYDLDYRADDPRVLFEDRPEILPRHILAAMLATGGIESHAATLLGLQYRRVKKALSIHSALREACADLIEINLDRAESVVMNAIEAGDLTAAFFYLKCKGKHRGWIERQELTGANGAALVPAGAVQVLQIGPGMTPQEAADAMTAMLRG